MNKPQVKIKSVHVSAEAAANEFKASVDAWLADYKQNHANSPNEYPLSLPAENSGLWGEFIYDFYNNQQ